MKSTIYAIDVETGEIPPGIQMTDEEDRKRRKFFAKKGLQPHDVARFLSKALLPIMPDC